MKYIFLGICSICILCTACSGWPREDSVIIRENNQGDKEGNQMQAQIDMTEEQRVLLYKVEEDK